MIFPFFIRISDEFYTEESVYLEAMHGSYSNVAYTTHMVQSTWDPCDPCDPWLGLKRK